MVGLAVKLFWYVDVFEFASRETGTAAFVLTFRVFAEFAHANVLTSDRANVAPEGLLACPFIDTGDVCNLRLFALAGYMLGYVSLVVAPATALPSFSASVILRVPIRERTLVFKGS